MKIQYLKNGIQFNGHHDTCFVPYYSINRITKVSIFRNMINFDWLTDRYTGEFVEKYCSFEVVLNTNYKIEVFLEEDIKKFPRKFNISKNWPWWKKIFVSETNKNGLSEEAAEWLNNKEKNMEEAVKNLTKIREELIEHINNWKICFKNA